MRGKYWCKRCEAFIRLSKTGAVGPHRVRQAPLVFPVPKLTEEQRKKLEAEVQRWIRDPNYIAMAPAPVLVRSEPPWCNERPFWPRSTFR